MFIEGIPNEYKYRITKVVNFILGNLTEDLSLQKLANIAQYSPFHFQKIFKQLVQESPKQFVIRMRLETAAHALIIYRHKTITETAFEHGFSSSATFARAFKSYYGVSADEFRDMRHNDYPKHPKNKVIIAPNKINLTEIKNRLESLNIRIKKVSEFQCVFVNANLDDKSIKNAFQKVKQIAETHNLISAIPRFAGAIYLHSGIYRSMIVIDSKKILTKHLNILEIPSAKYAVLDLDRSFKESIEHLNFFFRVLDPQKWLSNCRYCRLRNTW